MTPDDIALCMTTACPICAQQPNEPCTKDGQTLSIPHAERLEAAQFTSVVGAGGPEAEIAALPITDAEILGSGLLY